MSNDLAALPFYDLLQQLKSETFKDLRVSLPGLITAINSDGTVDVNIGVMQNVSKLGLIAGLDFTYPMLTSCPLFSLQGGGVGAIMPVEIGDECWITFSDRCIDAWFQSGGPAPLPNFRMHDIADGFVTVGPNSLTNPLRTPLLPNEGGICETDIDVPTNGAKIVVNSETHKINISNGLAGINSLYMILFAVLTALESDPGLDVSTHSIIATALISLSALLY